MPVTKLVGPVPVPRGFITGFTISNNAADPNKTIDIASGFARNDTNTANMELASSFSKILAANWTPGSGQAGLDTGVPAINTWYHVFIIGNDLGDLDFMFSTISAGPVLTKGFGFVRRIGSILTDGAGNILPFTQQKNEFLWQTPVLDVNAVAIGTAAILRVLSVPPTVNGVINVLFNLQASHTANVDLAVTSPAVTDVDPTTIKNRAMSIPANTTIVNQFNVRVNSNAQIRLRADVAAAPTVSIGTYGWIDDRGQN